MFLQMRRGIQKTLPGGSEINQNRVREPQNPSKKQLKSDSASEAASEPMEAKSKKKRLKCEALK